MADHYRDIPEYKPINRNAGDFLYEQYFEELQAKAHDLSCVYFRLAYNFPQHPEVQIWEQRSEHWYNYHTQLCNGSMQEDLKTTFDVYEAIGSFTAEYIIYTELEKKLGTAET